MSRLFLVLAGSGLICVAAAVAIQLHPELLQPARPVPPELPKPYAPVSTGEIAPRIKLFDLEGNEVVLGSPAGRPVLIYFWASWCAPCLLALPKLEASRELFEQHGVDFVSVAHDELRVAKRIVARIPVSFPVLVSEGAESDPLYAYGSRDGAVPYAVLLDATGTIVMQLSGEIDLAAVLAIAATPAANPIANPGANPGATSAPGGQAATRAHQHW